MQHRAVEREWALGEDLGGDLPTEDLAVSVRMFGATRHLPIMRL